MKEYFEYEDFQVIEDNIKALNDEAKVLVDILPVFSKKTWVLGDIVFISEVDRIERGIDYLNTYYVSCPNYTNTKIWLENPTDTYIKSFSIIDYNRWLFNLEAITECKDKIELRHCGESYCGEGVWL